MNNKNNKNKLESNSQAVDDFWTSVAIMQGPRNASVRTQRIKDLDDGKISLYQATPKGESALGLVLKGMIIKSRK